MRGVTFRMRQLTVVFSMGDTLDLASLGAVTSNVQKARFLWDCSTGEPPLTYERRLPCLPEVTQCFMSLGFGGLVAIVKPTVF